MLPRQNAGTENVLADDEVLGVVARCRGRGPASRSTYHKVMDREAWTHAVVSAAVVLEMEQDVCRSARVVLGGVAPIPWRLPEVERLLAGQRITEALAATRPAKRPSPAPGRCRRTPTRSRSRGTW